MAFEVGEYPPRTFTDKYHKYLAPQGVLLSPQQVFRSKRLGGDAEGALRKAFRITVKRLRKMRAACANCNRAEGVDLECVECGAAHYCSQECMAERRATHSTVCHYLKNELLDQVVECLPSPVSLGREVMRGSGGQVMTWDDYFTRHTALRERVVGAASLLVQWWPYTGLPDPGEPAIRSSLERIVTNVFSTALTIGHCAHWFPALKPDFRDFRDVEFHIHLLGADQPEVAAVESGLIQVASRALSRPLVVTLVAPDLTRHPQTFSWTPTHPKQVTPAVKAVAYPGLYHDFWREHVAISDPEMQVRRPDVALAIHPGVHTGEMLALWRPTLMLLALEGVPLAMTTFNEAEFRETLEKLEGLKANVVYQEKNPLGSLHVKQTPYEPDHVWAANSYAIAIDNTRRTT